jgi:hypothetical protein
MTSSTQINVFPSATTAERDADLTSVPDGSAIFNTTTNKLDFTIDGGSSWLEVASTEDVNNVDLQKAYDDGDGTIVTASSKPIQINTSLAGFQISGLTNNSLVTSDGSNNLVSGNLSGDLSTSGLTSTLATVNSNVGSFGTSSHVSTITVNGKGLITSASETLITPAAIGAPTTTGGGASGTWGINITGNASTVTTNANLTGDVTSVGNVTTLATVTGVSGTFGDSSHVSRITMNNKGLVTNASEVLITPAAIGAPTFNGVGAVGTWGINITGNASTVTTNANLTGDVTSVGNATTLANVTTGATVGNATNVPQLTFNNKGLVTSASNVPITGTFETLQGIYDNSLPNPTITQNNTNHFTIEGNAQTSGFEFLTSTDNPILGIFSTQDKSKIIEFVTTNLSSASELGRICGRAPGTAAQFDIEADVTDATLFNEDVNVTFSATTGGSGIDYLKFNGDTNTLSGINHISKVLDPLATISDVGAVDLQDAYNSGPGIIQLSVTKPFTIEGIDNTHPSGINFETPLIGGLTRVDFNALNSVSSSVNYGAIATVLIDPTSGSESGLFELALMKSGSLASAIQINQADDEFNIFTNSTRVLSELNVNGSGPGNPGYLRLYTGTQIAGDIGQISFEANTDAGPGSQTEYGKIIGELKDGTDGSEIGSMKFNVIDAGVDTEYMSIDASIKRIQFKENLRLINEDSFITVENFDQSTAVATSAIYISDFLGFDSNSNPAQYSEYKVTTPDVTALSHSGRVEIGVAESGTTKVYLDLDGNNEEVKVLNSTSKTLDTVATLSDIPVVSPTLQDGYDNGDGKITLTSSKPLEVVGINNLDPASGVFYTPSAGGTATEFVMDGENGSASRVTYGRIRTEMSGITAGDEDGSLILETVSGGSLDSYMTMSGSLGSINLEKNIRGQGNDIFDVDRVACDTLAVGLSNPSGTVATFFNANRYRIQWEDTLNVMDIANLQTPAASQSLFKFNFTQGTSENPDYAEMEVVTESIGVGTEDGSITLRTLNSGSMTDYLVINGSDDTVKVPNSGSGLLEEIATLSDTGGNATLQSAFDNGDGSITVSAGKQFEVIGINNIDNANIDLYTPLTNGVNTISMYADETGPNRTQVCEILSAMLDPTPGTSYSSFDVSILENGSLTSYMQFNGGDEKIVLSKETEVTGTLTSSLSRIVNSSSSSLLDMDYQNTAIGLSHDIGFYSQNSVSAQTKFGEITLEKTINTSGNESANLCISAISNGSLSDCIRIVGQSEAVEFQYQTNTNDLNSGAIINRGGFANTKDISLGGDLYYDGVITSVATNQVTVRKLICNEAITPGQVLKVSPTVEFRAEVYKATDIDSTPIIGIAHNTTFAAGEVVEIIGLETFPVILNGGVSLGNALEPSAVVDGRVIASAPSVGAFGVALQAGVANDTILAALIKNESF